MSGSIGFKMFAHMYRIYTKFRNKFKSRLAYYINTTMENPVVRIDLKQPKPIIKWG
jgi:hypothetical protein